MTTPSAQNSVDLAPPSRTSILVAAVRAFGSREPDESVRNPDSMADLLIGPRELALISDHPVSAGLLQDYDQASQNPAIVLFAGLMLGRTRYIDEALRRAVQGGATQIVILGAGFDTRAYRFQDLLNRCKVIEVDTAPTQTYKRQRALEVLGEPPANLAHCTIDFSSGDLIGGLRRAGFKPEVKTFYIWEGVSMYLPEASVRQTLKTILSNSAAGSALVMDYVNAPAMELAKLMPNGLGGIPADWAEPWIFGVPGANGIEFFRELGFDPGEPISTNSPQIVERYATRQNGSGYGARAMEQLRSQARSGPALPPAMQEAQKAVATAGGAYWLIELGMARTWG